MDHSTPGLPVHHQLSEFTQSHVHRVGDAIQPSHPLSLPSQNIWIRFYSFIAKYLQLPFYVLKSLSPVWLFVTPMDCSLPGFSTPGIFQASVLEWVAISFSRGSSWPRNRTQVSCIAGRCFTLWATREALYVLKYLRNNFIRIFSYRC